APKQFNATLLIVFSIAALMLAASGVYGVVSYTVTQSTTEIGIRMSLGSQPQDVLKLMAGKGLRPVLVGVAVGLAAALALSRALSSLLFNVSSLDPYVFVTVPVVITAIAAAAVFIPAIRATRVDPMLALREG
ncbi:MAG TPA: FtsX-like permease family protein, partial [Blastocatellia bacterium]|nr:FtsX-like permease family protein [Blastocatellia bacterium]